MGSRIVSLLTALGALGCGPAREPSERQGTDTLSTVRVQYCCDERVFGPFYDMPAKFLVFLPLFDWDEEGKVRGRLVRRWEPAPDFHTWTYHLRTGVRWHDGVPVTARDVKFTFDLLSHPDVLRLVPGGRTVSVLDDSTFTIRYGRRDDPEDNYTVIFPRHLLKDLDPAAFESWAFWTAPVGNGPYKHVRHVPNTMVELEANPDYYRGKPSIQRVVLKFGGVALTELMAGHVDVLSMGSSFPTPSLMRQPQFRVYHSFNTGTVGAIYWNHRNLLFREAKVRRALTLAIDRRELARLREYPDDVPLYNVIADDRQRRNQQVPQPLPHDVEAAKRTLEEAGWHDEDGDGIREREGREFRFTATVASSGPAEGQAAAVFVKSQLRQAGVHMEIRTVDGFAMVRSAIQSGDFDAAFHRFGDPNLIQILADDSPIGYHNPRLAGLVTAWDQAWDPDEQDRIYVEVMRLFQEDLPVTVLLPEIYFTVAHRRLGGLTSPHRTIEVWFMDELWIEEEEP